jgi:hypothetical protein
LILLEFINQIVIVIVFHNLQFLPVLVPVVEQ